ncbi:MAG TPA: xanthine dehydrogenase family protein subunit M [Polyangiaceae bacterium]|nr:xanthine dehydrogenase family protein subunit M [Polyangiaceae bacterium]
MTPFAYVLAPDAKGAVDASGSEGAEVIAGGTGKVDLMRLGVETPRSLVDVTALPWSGIDVTPSELRVGALVKNTDLALHPAVRASMPVLSEALLAGASPQLRNMASVGGNLAQRTRCSYFRDVAVAQCNKRIPGSGCAAIDGFHRMHAVLGASDRCIAAHPSDMCVALVALDAVVHTVGPRGERAIPVADFHVVPGDRPDLETVLGKGELVTHVTIPLTPRAARSRYVKVRDRASYAFALASAAVAVDLDGRTVREARVALGGVATKPWRCVAVEGALAGKPATRASFQAAAKVAVESARPRKDNAFKVELAQRVIVRALELATERA